MITTIVTLAEPAFGCEVCYGKADSPWIDASRMAVGLMLGIVFAVQLAFVFFFVHLWRRQRAVHDPLRRPRLVK